MIAITLFVCSNCLWWLSIRKLIRGKKTILLLYSQQCFTFTSSVKHHIGFDRRKK